MRKYLRYDHPNLGMLAEGHFFETQPFQAKEAISHDLSLFRAAFAEYFWAYLNEKQKDFSKAEEMQAIKLNHRYTNKNALAMFDEMEAFHKQRLARYVCFDQHIESPVKQSDLVLAPDTLTQLLASDNNQFDFARFLKQADSYLKGAIPKSRFLKELDAGCLAITAALPDAMASKHKKALVAEALASIPIAMKTYNPERYGATRVNPNELVTGKQR